MGVHRSLARYLLISSVVVIIQIYLTALIASFPLLKNRMSEPTGLAKVLILAAFLAWFVALVVIPIVRSLAHRVGLVDRPDPTRKLHRSDIALGGGLAVLIACLLSVLIISYLVMPALVSFEFPIDRRWLGLLGASIAIVGLGVIDDRFELGGKQKLLGQTVIVGVLAYYWAPSGQVVLFGNTLDLTWLGMPLLMVWLLATINAVNLIDGADGVASSFGFVSALGIALVAFVYANIPVAIVATALAFSLAGFLCFNRPPATIFLGDAGSMFIGLVLGTLSCWAVSSNAEFAQGILIPVALLGVPLFDSVTAILRRVLTGRSIYMGDRGHLHHILGAQIKERNLSPMWMLIAFGGLTAVTSTGVIVGAVFRSDLVAIITIMVVVAGLIWSRIFGHAEAKLLASHTRRVGGSIVSRVRRNHQKAHVSGVSLQGNRQWDGVWLPLVEFAEKNGLWQMKLDLNMPWQHEGYHGYWSRGRLPDKAEQWSVKLPIICQKRGIGRLDIIGKAEGESQLESLEAFSYLISEMQPAIEQLVYSLDTVRQEEEIANVPVASLPVVISTVRPSDRQAYGRSDQGSGTVRVATES